MSLAQMIFPIAFAAALVGMVLAELVARWWLRAMQRFYVWAPCYRAELGLDPTILPNLPPLVRFTVNREGERGDEIPRAAGSLYRVLVAGGSAAECSALDQEATWPVRVQRILERPENLKKLGASHVHVGNIGKSGVGAEALDFILRKVLPRYGQLDAVVLTVGGSDVQLWLREGAPHTYLAAWGDVLSLSEYFAWQPDGPYGWRPRHTALAEIARRLRLLLLRPVERRHGLGSSIARKRKARAAAVDVRHEVANVSVVVDNFEAYLRKAIVEAKKSARRVLFVEQPAFRKSEFSKEELARFWEGGVKDPVREETTTYYSLEVVLDLMRQVQERGKAVAEDLGVEHVELSSAIEPSLGSYYDLFHLAPDGAATLAELVAAALLRGHEEALQRQQAEAS